MLWRVCSISASGMLLKHRTVALLRLARREPRGSVFLNRKATGSSIHISYQMPMPMGAPSSELTGWLRRYSLVEPEIEHVAVAQKRWRRGGACHCPGYRQ